MKKCWTEKFEILWSFVDDVKQVMRSEGYATVGVTAGPELQCQSSAVTAVVGTAGA